MSKANQSTGLYYPSSPKDGVLFHSVGPHTQKDCNILETIKRRATRVVYKQGYKQQDVSPTEQLQELGWKTLQQRRREQRLTMMYRIDKELVAIPSDDLVEPTRHLKGHSRKFRTWYSCDTVKYSFYPRTIKQWNELTLSARN